MMNKIEMTFYARPVTHVSVLDGWWIERPNDINLIENYKTNTITSINTISLTQSKYLTIWEMDASIRTLCLPQKTLLQSRLKAKHLKVLFSISGRNLSFEQPKAVAKARIAVARAQKAKRDTVP